MVDRPVDDLELDSGGPVAGTQKVPHGPAVDAGRVGGDRVAVAMAQIGHAGNLSPGA